MEKQAEKITSREEFKELRVAMLQQDIIWANKNKNLDKFGSLISSLKGSADLVVLPEMFTTGFCVDRLDLAEDMNGLTVHLLKEWSQSNELAIAGSFMAKSDSASDTGVGENESTTIKYYNKAFLVLPNGEIHTADKKHLFSLGREHELFTSGTERMIAQFKGFNICVLVCYDVRFPVWSRNTGLVYDLLIYTANFPTSRISDWDTLLKARAIENQSYVVGLNRIGKDGLGLDHNGHSIALDFKANELVSFQEGEEGLRITSMEIEKLKNYRLKFPFWKDADMNCK